MLIVCGWQVGGWFPIPGVFDNAICHLETGDMPGIVYRAGVKGVCLLVSQLFLFTLV